MKRWKDLVIVLLIAICSWLGFNQSGDDGIDRLKGEIDSLKVQFDSLDYRNSLLSDSLKVSREKEDSLRAITLQNEKELEDLTEKIDENRAHVRTLTGDSLVQFFSGFTRSNAEAGND